jgi:hypothetical protein
VHDEQLVRLGQLELKAKHAAIRQANAALQPAPLEWLFAGSA